MSSHAPSLPILEPASKTRSLLVRRARTLSLLSIGWMTLEASVAVAAAVIAGSVALLAFGLDSLVELASAGTILWLYTGGRSGLGAAERRAQQLVAICFGVLALYVTAAAVSAPAVGSHPDTSWPGIAVLVGAIIVMPLLARAKGRVADAAQSWLCAISAAAVLVSILANAALGWWWLDPITGLGIAGLAVREGREAWAGKLCSDCAPISLKSHTDRGEENCC